MYLLKKAARIFDGTVDLLAVLGSAILIAVTLIVIYEVVMRYFLNRPSIWVTIYAAYSLAFITFLCTAWVLKREGHVKIDLLLMRLNPRTRAMFNVVTSILGAIVCSIVAWYSAKAAWNAAQIGYKAPTELLTPMWILVCPIPVAFFLLLIQFLRRAYLNLEGWRTSQGR